MLTVHHLENSQSIRILWLLEELGVDYEMKMYDRDTETLLAPADFKAVSPLGTAPAMTDGDLALSESNAIMDYILDRHDNGRLRPGADAPNRTRYLFWYHAAQGSLQPLLMMKFVFSRMRGGVPFFIKPLIGSVLDRVEGMLIKPRLEAIFALIEQDLGTADWFGGDEITAADMSMGYCMEAAAARAGLDKRYPKALAWIARMKATPSYRAAVKKDGKFNPLPA